MNNLSKQKKKDKNVPTEEFAGRGFFFLGFRLF
jgi:hypothetical protein